jgi:hypothetical protein
VAKEVLLLLHVKVAVTLPVRLPSRAAAQQQQYKKNQQREQHQQQGSQDKHRAAATVVAVAFCPGIFLLLLVQIQLVG